MNIDKQTLTRVITEELTKSDVKNMIDTEQSKFLKSKDYEQRVKAISTKVIEELYKLLWQRKYFWADSIGK